jgi:hypothetical protein
MKNSQSLHWMGVVKWILIVGLMSVLGLSYMLCKNQNLHIAEETHRLQIQLDAVQNRNAGLAFDLEKMKSSRELERRLVQMHSALVRLDDMRLTVVRRDQGTRMRLARIGTEPNQAINLDSPVAAVDAPPTQH